MENRIYEDGRQYSCFNQKKTNVFGQSGRLIGGPHVLIFLENDTTPYGDYSLNSHKFMLEWLIMFNRNVTIKDVRQVCQETNPYMDIVLNETGEWIRIRYNDSDETYIEKATNLYQKVKDFDTESYLSQKYVGKMVQQGSLISDKVETGLFGPITRVQKKNSQILFYTEKDGKETYIIEENLSGVTRNITILEQKY